MVRPAQTLASVAAMLQDAPNFKNREGNYAAESSADDSASARALLLPAGDGAAADDVGTGQVDHFA